MAPLQILLLAGFLVTSSLLGEIEVYSGQPVVGGKEYLMAAWNFNDVSDAPGTQSDVNHGDGALITNWEEGAITDFAGTTLNRFASDPAGRDLALRNGPDSINLGRHLEFRFENLALFEGLAFSYATRRSSTGFTDHEWWWSLDGESFTYFSTLSVSESYTVETVDFGGVAQLRGATTVYFRLVVTGLPDSPAATGNNRFDNFQIRATGIVAPGVSVLFNATGGSPYAGRSLFVPGEPQSVALTLAGTNSGVIDALRVTLPEGWIGIEGQSLELSGAGFNGATAEVCGHTIHISGATVDPLTSGMVTLHGVVLPLPEDSEEYGRFEVEVETARMGEELGAIAGMPEGKMVIPVAMIRPVNEEGVALASGERVAISGVVTVGAGEFHNERFVIFLQDGSAGVAIEHPSLVEMGAGAMAGMRFAAVGTVEQDRGLTRILLEGNDDLIPLGAGEMPKPMVRTIAELLEEAERLEGSLIRIVRARKGDSSAPWPAPGASGTLTITDGDGLDGLGLFLNRFTDVSWMSEPEYPIDLVGILGQVKTTAPFLGQYELLLRSASDVLPASEVERGFEGWRREMFDGFLEDPGLSGPYGDPDGDGVVNLMEYALGGDPWNSSRGHLPRVELEDAWVALTFRRVRDAEDLIYRVETSTDLATWTAIWSSEEVPFFGTDAVIEETVADVQHPGSSDRRFLRLVVTRQ